MQTKIMYSLITLFITTIVTAQQPVYTATINDGKLPVRETSLAVSIIPEEVATAFKLHVQNTEKKRIGVQITHLVYGVLVDTSFTSDQFNCRYNFDQVEDGHYQVILISGKEKVIKDIEINTITKRNLSIR